MRLGMLKATVTLMTLALGACGGAHMAAPESPAAEDAAPDAAAPSQPGMDAPADDATMATGAPAPASPGEAADMAPEPSRAAGGSRHRPSVVAAQAASVKAGEWNDNANYREFLSYLSSQENLDFERLDLSKRRFIVVRDQNGKGVPNCPVAVTDSQQRQVQLTTTASGRALLFPRAEGLGGNQLTVTTRCQGERASARMTLSAPDGQLTLDLGTERALPSRPVVEIAFVLDTTGSMSEEIASIKSTIQEVADALRGQRFDLRIGLVEYRDKTDAYVTKVHPMTRDIADFVADVSRLQAGGGGDTPEHANEGLRVAVEQLSWSRDSVARMAFMIGDAPPHLDYPGATGYSQSMKRANHEGIQVFTIAASGMDAVGQAVWRQIAQYTGGTNMFVLRGGAGPQSTGGGDPTSSCGGTQENYASGNLHELITRKVMAELKALSADPTRIAGLHQDENAKPCDKRLIVAG